MKQFFTLFLFLLFTLIVAHPQVNGYAKVTAIENNNMLVLSNVNETYGSFIAGQQVILMQMQDNVIGGNTGDDASFGNLASIQSAGLYEILRVTSVNRPGGMLNSIRLNNTPVNTYTINGNTSLQVVTFPALGNPNYTTTAELTALTWNGNVGGVLAFHVNGTLTLNHSIQVNGKGFRGGITNGGSSAECGDAIRYRTSTQDDYSNKGEGIYKATSANYAAGRGKIINGGGGGNSHNAGGGGGGNFSGGGLGGPGWVCSPGMGGLGGLPLRTAITSTRVFMGGGGGSGEGNNDNPTQGGNGGGIIFIRASTVRTTGAGDTLRISSNGEKAVNGSNDGVGGAGAGGSILLMVNSWNVAATKPILVTANGGDGGDVLHTDQHGGGGGGGQGVVINILSSFGSNIAATTTNGRGGLNNINGTRTESGTGTNNAGVIGMTVLPIKLIYFAGNLKDEHVQLDWKASDGLNGGYFEVQRSGDGMNFTGIGTVPTRNTPIASYSFIDPQPVQAVSYYRLRLVDNGGGVSYSKVIMIRKEQLLQAGISVFPNPASRNAFLHIRSYEPGTAFIEIMRMDGIIISTKQLPVSGGINSIALQEIDKMNNGVYVIRVSIDGTFYITRLVVQQ